LAIKVFFTWHAGTQPVADIGFLEPIAWDIPLTEGYEYELVPNVSAEPGTHAFLGLRNPALLERVMAWRPDVVHVSGWAWLSHLQVLQALHRLGGPRWWLKRALLRRVYSWPSGFLVVGAASRAYYERFGVEPARLHRCPHSIDVRRFAEPAAILEQEAARWRGELGISPGQTVLLYAGKFEPKKRPVELMRAVARLRALGVVLVLVGAGELRGEVEAIAAGDPSRFRVLPFQNQSRMPIVYRLGDVFVLPSGYGESWGLAVNEALACGRPVVVSDRVGCAADVVDPSCGRIFACNDWAGLEKAVDELAGNRAKLARLRCGASARAWAFDVAVAEAALAAAVEKVCAR
jgi:glycosyltransferase involved in cell wall biosynthesis